MSNLEKLKELVEQQKEQISREDRRERGGLEREKERELEKVKTEYDSRIRRRTTLFLDQKSEIEGEYHRRTSGEVLKSLDSSYSLLKERGNLMDLSPDEMRKAQQVLTLTGAIESDEGRKNLDTILDALSLGENVKRSIGAISGGPISDQEVSSYITHVESSCYLVSPINGDENLTLAKNLEEKLLSVMDLGQITVGLDTSLSRGQVLDASATVIQFGANYQSKHGFRFYEIRPDNGEYSEDLSKNLADKLGELQPDDFDRAKLVHQVVPVDFMTLLYFANHERKEMYSTTDMMEESRNRGEGVVGIGRAASMMMRTSRSIKTLISRGSLQAEDGLVTLDSIQKYLGLEETSDGLGVRSRGGTYRAPGERMDRLNYESSDMEERRQEAYARLDGYENDEINSAQFAHVLGNSNRTSVCGIVKKGEINARNLGVGRGRGIWILKDDVRKYMADRVPMKVGWKKSVNGSSS